MSILHTAGTDLESDLTQIRESLGQVRFPAQPDDVLAALVRRRVPSRLLWRVGGLPRTRRYRCLDDLCSDVARGPGRGAPPPPGR
jgi:hypothetical protein